jgi:assimilatory nitrate reductase electron transfer subunit
MSRPTRIVLIGYGPVGARLVEGLVASVGAGVTELTVVGAERDDAYNRVLLADFAVGRADRGRLELTDSAAAIAAGVRIRLGESAVAVDRERQHVRLDSGELVPYDRLIFATGARANIPSLVGLEGVRRDRRSRPGAGTTLDHGAHQLPPGIVALRDLADAAIVLDAVRAARRIIVLGAGVLGMEIALAASERGADVTAVFHGDIPMGRQLDSGGGRALRRAARHAGVMMAAHARAESIQFRLREDGEERFDAVVCADGKILEGDLLILSCGVGARTELAEQAGLRVSSGIVVDEQMRSWDDPDVFAIGDCAHVASRSVILADGRVPGGPAGLIGPGWQQADWLARSLVADANGASAPELSPPQRPLVVMLKAEGIDVVAGGNVTADPWDEGSAVETTMWTDPARGTYTKMVTRDGVLDGFVAVGLPRAGAELTLLFESRGELPADRSSLLRLDASDAGVIAAAKSHAPDATVCWCNGVTAQHILTAAEDGASTVEEVGACTRAGTGCGGCKGRIAELLARSAPVVPG